MLENLQGSNVLLSVYMFDKMITKFRGKLERSPINTEWYVTCNQTDNIFVLDTFIWDCEINIGRRTIKAFREDGSYYG